MIPASRAVSSGSPLGVRRSRTAATVDSAICTNPLASAVRAVTGLAPTSTIFIRPSSSRCESFGRDSSAIFPLILQRDYFNKFALIQTLPVFGHYDQTVGAHKRDEIRR